MSSNQFIEALNVQTGLSLDLDEKNELMVTFEDKTLFLKWLEDSMSFIVYVDAASLGGFREGDICKILLSRNFLFVDSLGGSISYDLGRNTVGLNYRVATYTLDGNSFLSVLNNILENAEKLGKTVAVLNAKMEKQVEESRKKFESDMASEDDETDTPASMLMI